MKKIMNYFLSGLLIVMPIALTVFVLVWAYGFVDGFFRNSDDTDYFIPPLLGLLVLVVIIFIVGFLASNYFGKKIVAGIDKFFNRLPVIKLLYSSIKDLVSAFSGDKKSFDKPALVEIIPNGPKVFGFITSQDLTSIGIKDHVSVYFPQSFTFAGNILIVPTELVTPLEVESSKAMAFIVSAGVAGK